MNMKIIFIILLALVVNSCSDPTPKRNHIPVIKENLYNLQTAVVNKNYAAIDSLLSPKILDKNQSSDSLVRFVYGEDDIFAFEQFGKADIVYTTDQARIDCYVMDSTRQTNRPLILFYTFEHEMWLLSSFETGLIDSLNNE